MCQETAETVFSPLNHSKYHEMFLESSVLRERGSLSEDRANSTPFFPTGSHCADREKGNLCSIITE